MQTLKVHSEVTDEGMVKIEVPCDLPAGPVEVEVTIRPMTPPTEPSAWKWESLYGLGAEIWRGIDAKEYLRELREDRDPVP
jgi:hypothetical protein